MPLVSALAMVVVYFYNNRTPEIAIPAHAVPTVNARDDVDRAAQLSLGMRHRSPISWTNRTQATMADYRAAAVEAEPIIRLLRTGLSKPFVEPPVRSATALNYQANAGRRDLARTIAGAADYYSMTGRPARAVDIRLDGWEMAVLIPHGAPLMGSLVGFAVEAICISGLEPDLERLSPDELRHVAGRIERIRSKRVSFAEVVREDGRVDVAVLKDGLANTKSVRQTYQTGLQYVQGGGFAAPPTFHDKLAAARWAVRDKRALLREYLDLYEELAVMVSRPYVGPLRRPTADRYLSMIVELENGGWEKHLTMEAVTEVIRAEVALFRYRADHGRYPDSLSTLAPKYLPSVPVDPFGRGGPLRYTPTTGGERFLLYSVGQDMKDDGGKPSRFPASPGSGDVVARRIGVSQVKNPSAPVLSP
jgi:hypothetical protein